MLYDLYKIARDYMTEVLQRLAVSPIEFSQYPIDASNKSKGVLS